MSVQLLDKTRKINKLLHNNSTHKVVFNDICRVLSDILESDILVISRKGKVLGIENRSDISELTDMIVAHVGDFIDPMLNERLLGVLSTKENVNLATLGFELENLEQYQAIISPIDIAGERLGTLFLYKVDKPYSIDDIILSEYATTVVGLEMLRSENEESAEEDRKMSDVRSAINTLSASEQEAIYHVFDELSKTLGNAGNSISNEPGLMQGMLVTSKIADRVGITRSVIVNALRKFESAGVIETRSAGMKGTSIKVINEYVYEEVSKLHN
ncbi:MAG: GTP-sensing pleiotropic transcriptional regulator CodY [Lachnospiraceae bacterium]|nr:GTP-sensing pleiotropic transcriptional regulator CodY [Lachnospiraceae bacterium]